MYWANNNAKAYLRWFEKIGFFIIHMLSSSCLCHMVKRWLYTIRHDFHILDRKANERRKRLRTVPIWRAKDFPGSLGLCITGQNLATRPLQAPRYSGEGYTCSGPHYSNKINILLAKKKEQQILGRQLASYSICLDWSLGGMMAISCITAFLLS